MQQVFTWLYSPLCLNEQNIAIQRHSHTNKGLGRGEREKERRERRQGEERTINTHRNTDVNFAVSCVYDLKAFMENKQSRGVRTRRHREQRCKGGKTSFSLLEFLMRGM